MRYNRTEITMAGKIIKILLLVIAVAIIAIGVLYAFNGSMELNPTAEQQEKARIGAAMIIAVGAIIGIVGVFIKSRKS